MGRSRSIVSKSGKRVGMDMAKDMWARNYEGDFLLVHKVKKDCVIISCVIVSEEPAKFKRISLYEDSKRIKFEDIFKKVSFNKYDLIEEGDAVILEYYCQAERKMVKGRFEVEMFDKIIFFTNYRRSFLYNTQNNTFINSRGTEIIGVVPHEKFMLGLQEI